MVQYVRHELINKAKWDNAIDLAVNGYIYGYSYYLDIVADGSWDALISDDYKMIMPLPFRKKFGFKYLYQPPFNQQLGIFYRQQCSNFDIIDFMRSIPKNISFAELNFNKYLYERLPSDLISRKNTNFELEMVGEYSRIFENYSTNLKRNLRKAEKNHLKIINYVRPEELVMLFRANKGNLLRTYSDTDYQKLVKLAYMLLHKGKAELKGVINENNSILAAALFVQSHQRKIFLFSGLNDEGKEKAAMPFLIDSYLKTLANQQVVFDFEGSNDPDLARFYAGFGAQEFYYQSIRFDHLPKPISWLKKTYSSFHKQ